MISLRKTAVLVVALVPLLRGNPPEPGLLFHVSAERGTTADFSAAGRPEPTFDADVRQITGGARGAALECGPAQQLAWRAPGNIYAQRGTLAFFWRSRYPVGPTEFPLFRVAYADHSSHDMVWLRIDYNGQGFDAFVTDASLTRTRVSATMQPFPGPKDWVHVAFSWDEARGVRLYLNGVLAASRSPVPYATLDQADALPGAPATVFDAALDQFGPHSRLISPHRVASADSYIRGGDIDELRIYDHMLSDEAVAQLALATAGKGEDLAPAALTDDAERRDAWRLRYGWEQEAPPYYPGRVIRARKVEIQDAYDLRRWWWKANDGIRETTWPGVYNRSRLPGRRDYFPLPDWDCYVESGQAITFLMPPEPWNHLEMAGAAWGRMELLPPGVSGERAYEASVASILFAREQGRHKSVHQLAVPQVGNAIRFVNGEQEQPIGELGAFWVSAGPEPAGRAQRVFKLRAHSADDSSLEIFRTFIRGRFPTGERSVLVGVPVERDSPTPPPGSSPADTGALPLVHLLLPNTWDALGAGLDGLAVDLPALNLAPTHGELIPLNVRVKDPLWPLRDLADFTFSVRAGERKTLWLDLRDRLPPPGRGLWIAIASAAEEFGAGALEGAEVRLVFKPAEVARLEHEADRFTQVRDCFAMLVEANPFSPQLDLWVRFETDIKDLLRVNPAHSRAREYLAVSSLRGPRPAYRPPEPPAGVPRWAFLQSELLGRVRAFVLWYIDRRQVPYGDFGGGISDDTDMTNLWPGVALMGCEPEKVRRSLRNLLEAAFNNGMFTNGLGTNQADQLHSYEEGINCLAQVQLLEHGSPRQLERAMATTRAAENLTGINEAGHRHFRTSYFSGTRMALEDPWGATNLASYLILHPGMQLVDFNGSPRVRRYLSELADGFLAHREVGPDERVRFPRVIRFASDEGTELAEGVGIPGHLLWAAWRWSGEQRYLKPLFDNGAAGMREMNSNVIDALGLRPSGGDRLHVKALPLDEPYRWMYARPVIPKDELWHWQLTGDKARLEKIYADQLEACDLLAYINTEGSLWIDRVGVPTTELQHSRLGGQALARNATQPGHVVSWSFAAPATERSTGILIPDGSPVSFTVIAYNLEAFSVRATMTGWNVEPGIWEIKQGLDRDGDDQIDGSPQVRREVFERSRSLELVLPPHATSVVQLALRVPGTPYWSRPDLGLDPEDVTLDAESVRVRVHGLGSVATPATRLVYRARDGREIAAGEIPPLAAPTDLFPKVAEVVLRLPPGQRPVAGSVEIDPDYSLEETTRLNNRVEVQWP